MALGIIAEYNPFHNGHWYHLQKIKQRYPNEEIILVLSGNFTERGEPSIIDKWKKSEIALKAGIDLIVELPFLFATQSADFFSYGAIKILEELKVDKLIFGSETNNIEELKTVAKCQINNQEFEQLVKIYSKLGENYPTAIAKAVYDLTKKKVNTPNDLLGVSYIKTILKNNYQIKPICIKRVNNYHSKQIKEISSATAIRESLKEKKDIKKAVPNFVLPYLERLESLHFQENYFPILKYKIMMEEHLEKYQTVDEGIDKKIKKIIRECSSYEELIQKLKTKRYTYNKLTRMLLHILVGLKKEFVKKHQEIEYIRILGFNDRGKKYLHQVKKEVNIKIISKFEKNHSAILDLELKATEVYSLAKNENNLILGEYQNHLGGEK